MITSAKIRRLAIDGDSDRLLEAVLKNGRPLPMEARLRCAGPDGADSVALALGLQRAIELNIALTEDCGVVLQLLLDHERESGGFGGACANAAAIRALSMALQTPGFREDTRERVLNAIDRASHALFCTTEAWRGAAALRVEDELDAALVVWQLHDESDLRALLGLDALEARLIGAKETSEAAIAVLSGLRGVSRVRAAA